MAQTTNLKLDKHPSGSAQSNNAVINNNWSKLDAAIANTIGSGILANRPASGQFNGATYWVTDQTGLLGYTWDGAAWQPLLGAAGFGILEDRPASAPTGWIYVPSDVEDVVLYVYDGASWLAKSAAAGSSGGTSTAIGTGADHSADEVNPGLSLYQAKAILTNYASQIRLPKNSMFQYTTGSLTEIAGVGVGKGGAAVASTGEIYYLGRPANNNDVYKYDPYTDTETLVLADPWGTAFNGTPYAAGVSGNGKVVFASRESTNEQGLWIDPIDGTYGTFSTTEQIYRILPDANGGIIAMCNTGIRHYTTSWLESDLYPYPSGFFGGWRRLPNGKIMIVNRDLAGTQMSYFYNPTAHTFENAQAGIKNDVSYMYETNGILTPDGKVIWIPKYGYKLQIYDIESGTWSESAGGSTALINNASAPSFCLLPSGEIFMRLVINISTPNYIRFYFYDPRTDQFYEDKVNITTSGMHYDNLHWLMSPDGRLCGVGSPSTSADNQRNPFLLIDMGFSAIGKGLAANSILMGST